MSADSADEPVPAPPEGFVRAEGRGLFSTHNGPYFYKPQDGETVEQAFFSLPRHANGVGLIHGGMLAAFMDGVLGQAVGKATGKVGVTIHLSVDYLHMGRVGDWIHGEGRLTRATRDVAFVEGRIWSRGVDLVRATGIFKLMERR